MMRNLGITIAFALIFSTSINAQVETSEKSNSGKFYALGGVQLINTPNINNSLVANGLPEINTLYTSFGFGGCWQTGKWIFGGEGLSLSGGEVDNNDATKDIKISATVGMGYLYAGYTALKTGNFHLTPIIGAGGSGVTVLINQKSETTLDDFLSGESANNLTTGGALIHSGLRLGYLLGSHVDLNIDLGYNYGFENEWNTSYGELSESVKDGIGGAYAQMSIGYIFR